MSNTNTIGIGIPLVTVIILQGVCPVHLLSMEKNLINSFLLLLSLISKHVKQKTEILTLNSSFDRFMLFYFIVLNENKKRQFKFNMHVNEMHEKYRFLPFYRFFMFYNPFYLLFCVVYFVPEYLDDSDDDRDGGDEEGGSPSIRRACSLSDLNNLPTSASAISSNGSSSTGRRRRSFNRQRNGAYFLIFILIVL